METLVALSNDLATAAERAAAVVWAVHARPRLPSSGVHWRDGLLVTANHTVRVDEAITVTSPDGRSVAATLVGRDPSLDLALLKLAAGGGAVAQLGEPDAVRMGHVVLALGAGPRVSWGVVSAVGAARARQHERDLLSLDLTLYPGFSGGPLVDSRGLVVGINTSGISRHLQLAVPASVVGRVVDDLVRHGRVPQAYLGVATQSVRLPEALRERLHLAQRTAVIVVEVQPGSPAADGLLIGDVLLALDGHAIADPFDLRAVLRRERIGARITASVVRAGERRDVPLTIGERPPHRR
jgi:S1-C subfamily serine protease